MTQLELESTLISIAEVIRHFIVKLITQFKKRTKQAHRLRKFLLGFIC